MPAISAPNPYHDRQRIRSRRVNHPAISDVPVACPVALPSHTLSVGDFGPTGGGRSLMRRSCWARRLASRTSRISTSRPNGQRKCAVSTDAELRVSSCRRPPGCSTPASGQVGIPPESPTRADGRGWLVPPHDGRQNVNRCYGGVGPCGNFLHRKIFAGRSCADRQIAVAVRLDPEVATG